MESLQIELLSLMVTNLSFNEEWEEEEDWEEDDDEEYEDDDDDYDEDY